MSTILYKSSLKQSIRTFGAPGLFTINKGRSISSFYDLHPQDQNGRPYDFSQLKNKVVLIVNVASKCKFTEQYKDLERLYRSHKDNGFTVLGFPCNQFGNQEPGTDSEIQTFTKDNYDVTFPILKKIDVDGKNTDPVYEFLKSKKSGILGISAIKWNFEKFLVDKKGNVVNRYASTTNPESIEPDIKKLLG